MVDRRVTMHMSQEFMTAAIQHYLSEVVIKEPVRVQRVGVEGERKLNQVDHFNIFLSFPDEPKAG